MKKWLITILTFLLVVLLLFPVFIIIMNTFKSTNELYEPVLNIIPNHFTLDNYKTALTENTYIRYMFNSFFVSVVATIITLVISMMAGYGLSHYKYKSNKYLLIFIMATVMVPLEVIMLPVFQIVKTTGLYNSLWGIIIPVAATPTGILIMRQNCLSIPTSLIEAARVEGLGEFTIFRKIVVPLSKTSLSTLAVFSFMWRWNDYLYPLIVISDPQKYTIQQAISNFAGENTVDWSGLLSISVLAMIPVIIVFLIFQKQFVEGVASTGSKE